MVAQRIRQALAFSNHIFKIIWLGWLHQGFGPQIINFGPQRAGVGGIHHFVNDLSGTFNLYVVMQFNLALGCFFPGVNFDFKETCVSGAFFQQFEVTIGGFWFIQHRWFAQAVGNKTPKTFFPAGFKNIVDDQPWTHPQYLFVGPRQDDRFFQISFEQLGRPNILRFGDVDFSARV